MVARLATCGMGGGTPSTHAGVVALAGPGDVIVTSDPGHIDALAVADSLRIDVVPE